MVYEIIIIGAGIGGLAAGLYAARQRMNYLIISKTVGGQMYESGDILNYPGIVRTTGAEFAGAFSKQIAFNKLRLAEEEVINVRRLKNNWKVRTNQGKYTARIVIVASGSTPRKLDIPGEKRFTKKGITYCAICDGPLFRGKEVAVIGGGNSALEAAHFMSRIARKVHVITMNPRMEGHAYLLEGLKRLKNVAVITKARTTKIVGQAFVNGIQYTQAGRKKMLKIGGIIVEIGRTPAVSFMKGLVDMDDHHHIKVDRWARCLVHGKPDDTIYAVGDGSDVHEYQYVISAGMGVTALLKAARYLHQNTLTR